MKWEVLSIPRKVIPPTHSVGGSAGSVSFYPSNLPHNYHLGLAFQKWTKDSQTFMAFVFFGVNSISHTLLSAWNRLLCLLHRIIYQYLLLFLWIIKSIPSSLISCDLPPWCCVLFEKNTRSSLFFILSITKLFQAVRVLQVENRLQGRYFCFTGRTL